MAQKPLLSYISFNALIILALRIGIEKKTHNKCVHSVYGNTSTSDTFPHISRLPILLGGPFLPPVRKCILSQGGVFQVGGGAGRLDNRSDGSLLWTAGSMSALHLGPASPPETRNKCLQTIDWKGACLGYSCLVSLVIKNEQRLLK